GRDVEALALAAPTDRLRGPLPARLRSFVTNAFGVLEDARLADWKAAASVSRLLASAWPSVRRDAPPLIAPRLRASLTELVRAVPGRDAQRIPQLALDVARFALDLELRFRPAAAVDVERFHWWTQQLRVDAAAGDLAAVNGDVATLEW